jgi:KaiC/GvpD/RAD55 family RecA-like ATPase
LGSKEILGGRVLTIERIICAAMTDQETAGKLQEALRSDLVVANPFQRQITTFLMDFVNERRVLPLPGDYNLWVQGLSEHTRPAVTEQLSLLQRQDISSFTLSHLADVAMPELRKVAAKTALARLNEDGVEITPEVMLSVSEQVDSIRSLTLDGLARIRDVDKWIRLAADVDSIPSGINTLDRYLGGFKDELVLLMADSGIGKTTTLCNFGEAASFHGKMVLHVTMELSTLNTVHRYYRKMAFKTRPEFRTNLQGVREALLHRFQWAKGDVFVLFQEAYTLDPHGLRTLCRRFIDQHGALDMLIIDYIDLMRAPSDMGRLDEYQQLGRVSHMVRNFREEFECAIISATQATRSAAGGRRLRLDHMGDSYNKVRAADVILGLAQTDEEREAYQGRLSILKARESPGTGLEIPVFIDMDVMVVSDLDHPNTIRWIQERGIDLGAVGAADDPDAERDQSSTAEG